MPEIIPTIILVVLSGLALAWSMLAAVVVWALLCTLIGWAGRKWKIWRPAFINDWDINHETPMVVLPPETQLEEPHFTLSELNAAKEYIDQCKS